MMSVQEAAVAFKLKHSHRGFTGDCPICGYANSFVVDANAIGAALGWCSACRNIPAINSLLRMGGTARVQMSLGRQPLVVTSAEKAHRRREAALRLWTGAVPLTDRDAAPGRAYLAGRGLPGLVTSESLRFRPDCPHPDKRRYLALLAVVQDTTGHAIALHRTFINSAGRKASIEPVRATLGPVAGGGVWLNPPAPEMVVAEGIETAGAAGVLFGLPAVAAISAGNLGHDMRLPQVVRRVTIAADPDKPGVTAAAAASGRWQAEGRSVRVVLPSGPGDFNDHLMVQQGGE